MCATYHAEIMVSRHRDAISATWPRNEIDIAACPTLFGGLSEVAPVRRHATSTCSQQRSHIPDRFGFLASSNLGLCMAGCILRVVTFALNFPLWGDEAFVAVNLITRGYRDLLRPLDYGQICPLLFLWLELTAVKLFGFSEWSLRLIPTLCSVASVFLFAHMAGRVTRGPARLLAVAIFAVAYYPIRHGAEVKPYSTDLLAALILLCAGDRVVEDAREEPLALGACGRRSAGARAVAPGGVRGRRN